MTWSGCLWYSNLINYPQLSSFLSQNPRVSTLYLQFDRNKKKLSFRDQLVPVTHCHIVDRLYLFIIF